MDQIFAFTIGVLGIGLIIYIYYFFGSIALAIWTPQFARQKWIDYSKSLKNKIGYFFFKWIASSWVLLVTISIILKVILLALKPESV